jgi:hypothetical protein
MPTASECRQHARDCLQLASTAVDFYVQAALTEFGGRFSRNGGNPRTDQAGRSALSEGRGKKHWLPLYFLENDNLWRG